MRSFYEFFAGGGMARAGLGSEWTCLFANDFDHKKGRVYADNWGASELHVGDIRALSAGDLPGHADLVWGSFPCQDLSLAGGGAGLKGDRSGTFWPFWSLIKALQQDDRRPKVVVLENVVGTLTSHNGKDFAAICKALSDAGYRFGAMVIDAAAFVPQSRPRLFIIAAANDIAIPEALIGSGPGRFCSKALGTAFDRLPASSKKNWLWWDLNAPPQRNLALSDVIEDDPLGVVWHQPHETEALLAMMSPVNAAKVENAKREGRRVVGGIYRRTRVVEGKKVQRAEVRFDLAGCLRTPAGGSSRQIVLVIDKRGIRTRLISSRETARLMGLPDEYRLPPNYNEAYHLTGDGVAVPVVRFIAQNILEPLLDGDAEQSRIAA